MEEKQPNKKAIKKKLNNKLLVVGGIFALAVIVVLVLALSGWGKGVESNKEPQIPTTKINTPFIDLILPESLEGTVAYDVSTFGTIYTYAFYMSNGEQMLPLWRFDFGDPNMGEWVGVLKTDEGDVPVVTTLFVISTEKLNLLDEDASLQYSECMDGYSVMLNGIMADPRFSPDRPLAVGEDTSVKLTYWTVTLPNTMKVSEYTADGNYEAVFSAEVVGEMVMMYRVCIGDEQAESLLGYYEADGVKKPVSVEIFDLVERDNWSEDDYAAAYRMMDTINHVIDTIMQSKQFSTEAE